MCRWAFLPYFLPIEERWFCLPILEYLVGYWPAMAIRSALALVLIILVLHWHRKNG
nr:hypothetical protein [Rhizobium sp. ACO-34A]